MHFLHELKNYPTLGFFLPPVFQFLSPTFLSIPICNALENLVTVLLDEAQDQHLIRSGLCSTFSEDGLQTS